MVTLTVPKGLGYQVSNLLRQMVICSATTINIVAFKLNGNQELLQSGDIDLVKFPAKLQNLKLIYDSNVQYPTKVSIDFTGVLTVKDLMDAGIGIESPNVDDILLMSVSKASRTVEFIINEGSSYLMAEENRNLVMDSGFTGDCQSFQFLSTRNNDYIMVPNVKEGLYNDTVSFSIRNGDETAIVSEIKGKVLDIFNAL